MTKEFGVLSSCLVGVLVAVGCSTSATDGTGGNGTGGNGTGGNGAGGKGSGITFAVAATPNDPIDATPDAKGETIYYLGDAGQGLGLHSVPAAGGQASKKILSGTPLVTPVGVAYMPNDGKVYVADKTAGLVAVNPMSGAAVVVPGTEAAQPLALDVVDATKTIYFTSAKDGTLYAVPAAGGTPTAISEVGKFKDPEGVAVARKASTETVFVADRNDGKSGVLYKVSAGKSTQLGGSFFPGTPTGIALPLDESVVAVSSLDATGATSEVDFFDVTTGAKTTYNDAIKQNHGSGGLHRAYDANVFAWCGIGPTGPTGPSGGSVYRVGL